MVSLSKKFFKLNIHIKAEINSKYYMKNKLFKLFKIHFKAENKINSKY